MHHFFVWFNKNRVPTEDAIMTKIGSCLRCLKGQTLQTNGPAWTPPRQSPPVFLSAPLCPAGHVRPLPLFQSGPFEKCGLHTRCGWTSQSGAWEMMDSIHALNRSQGHRGAVLTWLDLLPWPLLPRCWWHSSPGDPTRWVANPDLLQDHFSRPSNPTYRPRASCGDRRW